MSRFGVLTELTAHGRRRLRRASVLAVTMTLALVLAGCGGVIPSTNSYPIDFFSEMHYQKSWGAGEPDGLNPPDGAVPITGGEVAYEQDEAADLENPFEADAELGSDVYVLNCQHCHGPDGEGDGPVRAVWEFWDEEAPLPANLQESDLTEGEMFYIVTYGLGTHMPAFQRLLTQEQRWAVVEHLREEIQQ